ncbi:MAG TPA: hypothetical protein VLQ93_00110 [Myxococcaceae bacterium]|nr:hypothetical protein [Myxococcaceae bacterium]
MAQERKDEREKRQPKVHSGDVSGKGRERRADSDVYPKQRNAGEFGTHGGPRGGQKVHAPGSSKAGNP